MSQAHNSNLVNNQHKIVQAEILTFFVPLTSDGNRRKVLGDPSLSELIHELSGHVPICVLQIRGRLSDSTEAQQDKVIGCHSLLIDTLQRN